MKVLSVVGARPQFVKAAPLARVLADRDETTHLIVHTGQHFDADMSQVFFDELEIPPPAYSLGIHGGGHGDMTGRMLIELERVLLDEAPDVVVVYGDTNSTVAAALAAAKLHVPIAHVEAGLRSFNRRMPEEINRVVADHLSSLLLCPTSASVDNLRREGIVAGVRHVGDVMYDAALHARDRASTRSSVLEGLELQPGQYAVATVHRAENTESADALARVAAYLDAECDRLPVILPLHPRTRGAASTFGIGFGRVRICEPLGYLDMTRLTSDAAVVITDSGGLQKEAYFHGVPCVTLRHETEWVETIAAGWNRLWSQPDYVEPRRPISDYGIGDAAVRIADAVVSLGPSEACR